MQPLAATNPGVPSSDRAGVASKAENSPDFSRAVIVIEMNRCLASANCTQASLKADQLVNFVQREPVGPLHVIGSASLTLTWTAVRRASVIALLGDGEVANWFHAVARPAPLPTFGHVRGAGLLPPLPSVYGDMLHRRDGESTLCSSKTGRPVATRSVGTLKRLWCCRSRDTASGARHLPYWYDYSQSLPSLLHEGSNELL